MTPNMRHRRQSLGEWLEHELGWKPSNDTVENDDAPRFGMHGVIVSGLPCCAEAPAAEEVKP